MWRTLMLAAVFCSVFAAFPARAEEGAEAACASNTCGTDWVYFGTRTSGQGILAARFDASTGRLFPMGVVADVNRAAWLLSHPSLPVLYAVSDGPDYPNSESSVFSLEVDRTTGKLKVMNSVHSGGAGATHLTFDSESKSVFVAHYGSGHVSWLPVSDDGRLGIVRATQSNYGTGPHRRQASPHAHGVAVDPSRRYVLAADLGADRVFVYRFDTATNQLTPAATPFVSTPPGSGPRHLAFHPNGKVVFLVTELAAEVVSYKWDDKNGRLQHVQTVPMDEPSFTGQKSAAHIETSRDGRYLYVSNRGSNSIQVYAVNARSGKLSEVQGLSSQGKTPWDFSLDPSGRWMLVANYGSNSINVLAVDTATGELRATQESMTMTQPSNVTFLPAAN